MTTDTKAVARWDAGTGVNPRVNGKYVLFTDHEQLVTELEQQVVDSAYSSVLLQRAVDQLRSALAAKSAEVEGLREVLRSIAEHYDMDGYGAAGYGSWKSLALEMAQAARTAMEKSNEHQDQ